MEKTSRLVEINGRASNAAIHGNIETHPSYIELME